MLAPDAKSDSGDEMKTGQELIMQRSQKFWKIHKRQIQKAGEHQSREVE